MKIIEEINNMNEISHINKMGLDNFRDVIKEILSQMDLETSLYFMEVFNEKMAKLKAPDKEPGTSSEMRLAEAKLLNETINKKINE